MSEAVVELHHNFQRAAFRRGEGVAFPIATNGAQLTLHIHPGGKLLNAGHVAVYVRNASDRPVSLDRVTIECDAPGHGRVRRKWSRVALRPGGEIGEERFLKCAGATRGGTFRVLVESREPPPELRSTSVHDDLLNILDSGDGSDVTLRVGVSDFRAHAFVLKLRCPYFRACLTSLPATVDVPALGCPDTARAILRYIYGGVPPDPDAVAPLELARVADALGLEDLRAYAEELAARAVNGDNVVETLLEAGALDLSHTMERALEFLHTEAPEGIAGLDLLPDSFLQTRPI